MALDGGSLRASEFWKKKIHTWVMIQDVDKDGFITRADFDIIVQRYKDNGSPPEHMQKLQEAYEKLFVTWGINDKSKKLSTKEFEEMWIEGVEKSYTHADEIFEIFSDLFQQVDMNGDGWLSLHEWEVGYIASGIDTKYAKASFEAADANGDGQVSLQEFLDYVKEFFFSTEDKLKSSILYGPLLDD